MDPVRNLHPTNLVPKPDSFVKTVFATWIRILKQVPRSILWLLRFPSAAEEHLLRTASLWGGPEVAARVRFTDVAKKEAHVRRGRVADLFLDTFDVSLALHTSLPLFSLISHRETV